MGGNNTNHSQLLWASLKQFIQATEIIAIESSKILTLSFIRHLETTPGSDTATVASWASCRKSQRYEVLGRNVAPDSLVQLLSSSAAARWCASSTWFLLLKSSISSRGRFEARCDKPGGLKCPPPILFMDRCLQSTISPNAMLFWLKTPYHTSCASTSDFQIVRRMCHVPKAQSYASTSLGSETDENPELLWKGHSTRWEGLGVPTAFPFREY